MSSRIETEKKYYCVNNRNLLDKIKQLNYKLVSSNEETDEYFTDINSEYIKNRTCLRIRKSNNNMEITFKGKSKVLSNIFTKLETNFSISIENYDDFVKLFAMLGYNTYTVVKKKRSTYQLKKKDYTYNIMVDDIEELGDFVEFEIITESLVVDEYLLKNKINKFVSLFSGLDLEEAKLPYRDFVAKKKYNDILPSKKVKGIHINLDQFLKSYEKEFYSYYKLIIKKSLNISIKWNEFKKDVYNSMFTTDITSKFDEYFNNLGIYDNKFITFFELVKKIKNMGFEVVLSTNINKTFIDYLVAQTNVDRIIHLNNNTSIHNELKKNNIDIKEFFNIVKSNLNEINSYLLIIINNYDITKR